MIFTINEVRAYKEHSIIIKNKGGSSLLCAPTKHFIGWNDGTKVNVSVGDGACMETPSDGCGNGKIVAAADFIWVTTPFNQTPFEDHPPPFQNPAGPAGDLGWWGQQYWAYQWDDDGIPTGYGDSSGWRYCWDEGWGQWVFIVSTGVVYALPRAGVILYGIWDGYNGHRWGGGWVTTGDPELPPNEYSWTYTYDFGIEMNPTLTNNEGDATYEWLDGNTQLKITKTFTDRGQECSYIRMDCKELIP